MPLQFGFLSEARAVFVWTAKSIYFILIFFVQGSSLWNMIVCGRRIELLCAFVNSVYLHAWMRPRELPGGYTYGALRQRNWT